MKITLNIEDWLEAKVTNARGEQVTLQDGMQISANTAGVIQIRITQGNDCKNTPMSGASSSASGSLSFA